MADRLYLPTYEGAISGYVLNFLRRNYWRVAASHERDDVLQESYEVFLRCAERYGLMDTPKHFMALYKTAWTNHFHDLARKDSTERSAVTYGYDTMLTDDEVLSLLDIIPGELDTHGYLNTLLQEAPRDVATILAFFLNAPPVLLQRVSEAWTRSGRRKADGNNMLCELLGFPKGTDLIGKVEAYLTE